MDFKAAHSETPVKRYRLTFNSEADYREAVALCAKKGFIAFYNGSETRLIGHPVRTIEEYRIIEVDAAEDVSIA
ncbi:MAG: hypothetical protein ISN26_06590 [Betaproteobacteria bacterium AqS2]|uniref:Uncharacterized protein n=1 Tax=Candidatus Amphirhobacter heronislandensis TaxID=1732024 RepID=A0A930UH88_9GAMM|nr:hypothetical protein [Betaproteobacteria bacterium AqS2]